MKNTTFTIKGKVGKKFVLPDNVGLSYQKWRSKLLLHIRQNNKDNYEAKKKAIDEIIKTLTLVARILEVVHGTPDFGNVADPLDELIFMTISQRTKIKTARVVFQNLKTSFPKWDDVLNASDREISEIVSIGGRGTLRTRAIKELLAAVQEKTGKLSLQCLENMNEKEVFDFLMSLPWVGEKIARCVMMFSLGYDTFPTDVNVIRIFRRSGILKPFIGPLDGIEHRKAQRLIALYIPPQIAKSLHINMVAHGQDFCRERNPRCELCEIKKFCKFYRGGKIKESKERKLILVDLFCGAGGISLGFIEEGFKILLAVDNNPDACRTYRLNLTSVEETKVLQRDISCISDNELRDLTGNKHVDVLTAGVPCQGFSRVGYRSKPELRENNLPRKDPRNILFMEVVRITKVLRPRIVLLENVPDITIVKVNNGDINGHVPELLKENLENAGYHTYTVCINAKDFGIPQTRKRLFFIGLENQQDVNFTTMRVNLAEEFEHNKPPTLKETIEDLSPLKQGEGNELTILSDFRYSQGESLFVKFVKRKTKILYHHLARKHNEDDMKIIRALKPGENYVTLLKRKPEVVDGRKHKIYSKNNFHDKFYRLTPEVSRTIVAHLAKDGNSFIHPWQDRSLTVREAARIQSFPDDYIFMGSRSSQFIQIGNAVPPLLAKTFARFFRELLEKKDNGN